MAIVGISGSPIVGGNTDRIIKALLEKSGKETKFINLSTLKFSPCRACAHLCGTTNMCGVKDDLQPYLADIRDAEVLILGSPIHHGNCTAWTYSFISRLWCLYQVKKLLQDKPAIFVSVGIHDRDRQNGICNFERIATYSEKLKVLGHIYYNSQTPPCLKCGAGAYCKVGGSGAF
jgi:multimeric flavodoxin WrbA